MDRGRLLVLTHRDVPLLRTGVQVPAGTCRPGEDPAAAVLRETREETGYDCFAVTCPLGVEEYRLSAAKTHVRHFFPTRFTFSWLPLADAHVLAAGLSARLADVRAGY